MPKKIALGHLQPGDIFCYEWQEPSAYNLKTFDCFVPLEKLHDRIHIDEVRRRHGVAYMLKDGIHAGWDEAREMTLVYSPEELESMHVGGDWLGRRWGRW